jgi:hypothetical protein
MVLKTFGMWDCKPCATPLDANSRLSKADCPQVVFVQYPGVVHLQAAERDSQYVRGTYHQGITFCDLGAEVRNKLGGWIDSDFGSDPHTRKSMTG